VVKEGGTGARNGKGVRGKRRDGREEGKGKDG